MNKPLYKEYWPVFAQKMEVRLKRGAEEYGDISFERAATEVLGELEQEALDIAGWAFVLWTKLYRLREATKGRKR